MHTHVYIVILPPECVRVCVCAHARRRTAAIKANDVIWIMQRACEEGSDKGVVVKGKTEKFASNLNFDFLSGGFRKWLVKSLLNVFKSD